MHKCTSGIEEGLSHEFIPGTIHSANNTEYQLVRCWRGMPSNASDKLADVAVVPPSYIIILIKTNQFWCCLLRGNVQAHMGRPSTTVE
jgi:hypothetical protein